MSTADCDELEVFLADDVIEDVGAFGGADAEFTREEEFWVVGGERGGVDEPIDEMLGVDLLEELAVLGADVDVSGEEFFELVGEG